MQTRGSAAVSAASHLLELQTQTELQLARCVDVVIVRVGRGTEGAAEELGERVGRDAV